MLRAIVAGLLVPLMVLLVTAAPSSVHACGGDDGMADGCSCIATDAEVPQAKRLPCCEPEPEAAPSPVVDLSDDPLPMAALGQSFGGVVAASYGAVDRSGVALARGPPPRQPLYLRHCSLLR